MNQVLSRQEVIKVLQDFPEIVELTETRKRAIAGGRASIETALKRMVDNDKRPTISKVIDYEQSRAAEAPIEESPESKAMRLRQEMIYRARAETQNAGGVQDTFERAA